MKVIAKIRDASLVPKEFNGEKYEAGQMVIEHTSPLEIQTISIPKELHGMIPKYRELMEKECVLALVNGEYNGRAFTKLSSEVQIVPVKGQ